MSFGIYLKSLRTGVVTQRELAEKIGVSHTYISKIENNVEPPPNEDILIKIANVLNVDKYKLMIAADKVPNEYKEIIKENQELCNFLKIVKDKKLSLSKWEEIKNLIENSENKYWSLFHDNKLPMLLIDPETSEIVDANLASCNFYGYSFEELRNLRIYDINILPDKEIYNEMKSVTLEKKNCFNFKHRLFNNEIRDVIVNSSAIEIRDRKLLYSIIHDVTNINKKITSLREYEKKYEKLLNSTNDSIFISELGDNGIPNRVIEVNDKACKYLGYSKDKLLKILPEKFIAEENYEDVIKMGNELLEKGYSTIEITHISKDGEKIPIEISSNTFILNDKRVAISIVRDITERKKSETEEKIKEERIYNLAFKDGLTNLYNRAFFLEKLNDELVISKDNKEKIGLLFIDFDGFKRINDNLGHSTGDKLLKMIAERLKNCIYETDIIARMGGDEFAILLSKINDVESLVYIAEKILYNLKDPFSLNENEIYMSAGIGISVYPDNGSDVDELIARADIALSKAKNDSENKIQLYSHNLNEETKKKFIIENYLRYALDKNELYLNYQPIIDVNTKQIIGAEALLRWKNPELGFIPPDKFIPIAESTGLILPIGKWVLETACEQNKKWQNAGYKHISIAVNISVRQLENIGFIESVENILKITSLNPKYLDLEITESVAIKNINNTIKTLKKLNDLGVKWSIDDFGTGYSSLGQLNKIAINTLKIDKTFVNDIVENNDTEIASAIISMAHKLKLNVVAEGVETENQLEFLKNNRCDMAQGYLFSKPIDENLFEKLLDINSNCKTNKI